MASHRGPGVAPLKPGTAAHCSRSQLHWELAAVAGKRPFGEGQGPCPVWPFPPNAASPTATTPSQAEPYSHLPLPPACSSHPQPGLEHRGLCDPHTAPSLTQDVVVQHGGQTRPSPAWISSWRDSQLTLWGAPYGTLSDFPFQGTWPSSLSQVGGPMAPSLQPAPASAQTLLCLAGRVGIPAPGRLWPGS